MVIKIHNIPDISDLNDTTSATGHFLLISLAGLNKGEPLQIQKTYPLLARLIDKAIYEYLLARDFASKEDKENKLTYEQIKRRGEGQVLYYYSLSVTNHFENCINAICRIYKLIDFVIEKDRIPFSYKNEIRLMRNTIEHMEERILSSLEGTTSLNVSIDGLSLEINGKTLTIENIANQIRFLHKEIKNLIYV